MVTILHTRKYVKVNILYVLQTILNGSFSLCFGTHIIRMENIRARQVHFQEFSHPFLTARSILADTIIIYFNFSSHITDHTANRIDILSRAICKRRHLTMPETLARYEPSSKVCCAMTTIGVMSLVPLRLKLSESVPEMENI